MDPVAYFDQLNPVSMDDLWGVWKGASYPTGHPMDGALEAFRWYGKEFVGPDEVHPLLFHGKNDRLFAVDPAKVPMRLVMQFSEGQLSFLSRFFPLLSWYFQTRRSRARLRMLEFRGKLSATMIYDELPILDTFRKVDADSLLGWMDMKGMERPFFFLLQRP